MRDDDGNPIDQQAATALAATWLVPEDVRRRARAHSAACKRGRLSR